MNKVECVFILDRSGSMAGLESDTINGFNGLLNKQRTQEGEALITTVLFDHDYELLHDRIDIKFQDSFFIITRGYNADIGFVYRIHDILVLVSFKFSPK